MNRGPFGIDGFGGPRMNPMPGGSRNLADTMRCWCEALTKDDQHQAAEAATDLLRIARNSGSSGEAVNELHKAFEATLRKVANSGGRGGCSPGDPDGIKSEDEQIDWCEPETKQFYVLDQRSGIELADVLLDLQHQRAYLNRGARAPNRLLFVGEPGSGKTVGAKWLGSQLKLPVALIRIDGIVSSLAGKTSKNLRAAFELATARKGIIVIDEFEAVAVNRVAAGPNVPQWTKETTSALLQLFDSLPVEQCVIGCTNVPDAIDPALLRRLRKHVYFHPPDRDARAAMLKQWWSKAPHMGDAKSKLLDLTEGRTGDFLERAAETANRSAARRHEKEKINMADVEVAVASLLGALGSEDVARVAPAPSVPNDAPALISITRSPVTTSTPLEVSP